MDSPKFCKDCAHCEVIDGTHLCACDERVSLVTGEKHVQRTSCTLERATEVAGCGAEGRWWRTKEVTTISIPIDYRSHEEVWGASSGIKITPHRETPKRDSFVAPSKDYYRSEVTQREEPEPKPCTIHATVRGFRLLDADGSFIFEHDMFSEVFSWAQENNYHIANPS